jgi:8-oxo-dGTP diphosphatase
VSENNITEVAVAVLVREDGKVLLSSRPEGKAYAGYWEFPGGKIEKGETPAEAIARELEEELGVKVSDSFPWFVKEFRYPHAHVRLHFRRSYTFYGKPVPKEGQECGFFAPTERTPGLLLPADEHIVRRIDLPDVWEDSAEVQVLSRDALQAAVVRKSDYRFVGARAETLDDVLKAVAMDYDFVIVRPEALEATFDRGEPRIPTYVEGVPEADLRQWQEKGAHGVKPNM